MFTPSGSPRHAGAPGPGRDAAVGQPAPARLAWPDAARGLAIGLVVLYHATNWTWQTGYEVGVLREINETLRSLRMPLFFTVAGMFAGKWVAAPWSRLARGKLLFFAWVFVLWEPISLVVRLLTGYYQVADADWGTLGHDLAWSLLVPRSELWFLWTLAVFFVIARVLRRVPVVAQLLLAAAVGAWALAGWEPESIAWRGTAQFALFFLAGLHLRPLLERFAARITWYWAAAAVAVWLAIQVVVRQTGVADVPGFYLLANVAGVPAGVAVSVLLSRVPGALGLRWLGARTLPVFVTHTSVVLALLSVLWRNAIWIPAPQSQWLPVALWAAAVGVGLLLGELAPRLGARWLFAPPRRLAGR
ncbi:acyltransferase family protein [Promicromonospora thailandica]|uniref:Membrane protein YcfT n=1 Tax=Promicromonospora thailandica TaxID=765201 RepID=A0A9X2G8D8_9MICO|nr:acyltransferase family protein [Promicromonospora thailandica]MCP2264521.1 putative membrane protein YcfT [Promicromonospora thailandica]